MCKLNRVFVFVCVWHTLIECYMTDDANATSSFEYVYLCGPFEEIC